MITTTARKHITKALKQALRIPAHEIADILDRRENRYALDTVMRPVHNVIALVGETTPGADLYVKEDDRYHFLVSLVLNAHEVREWKLLSIEEAYANAMIVFDTPPVYQNDDWLRGDFIGACNQESHVEIDITVKDKTNGAVTTVVAVMIAAEGETNKDQYNYVLQQLGRSGSFWVEKLGENSLGLDPETRQMKMFLPSDREPSEIFGGRSARAGEEGHYVHLDDDADEIVMAASLERDAWADIEGRWGQENILIA